MDPHRDPINERSTLRIVHALPGRLRFRGPARAGSEEVAEALRGLAGVRSCSWSPRTRSILVLFEPEKIPAEAITLAVARHVGIDESLVADLAHDRPTGAQHGRATFAAGVAETFGELDRRVHRTTRGLVGLGALVPLVLMVWAAREIAVGRTAPLAWSTALWYAHGLFRDYNSPPAS
ncbi:MAG: hypothetical protein LAO05_16125 [Acidobacteriia bacterium]|nr:hypothetical protein [Terriglobia bacterium]